MPDESLRRRCRYHRSDPSTDDSRGRQGGRGYHFAHALRGACRVPRCPGRSPCPNDGCVRSARVRTLITRGGASTYVAHATGASVGTSSEVGESVLAEG